MPLSHNWLDRVGFIDRVYLSLTDPKYHNCTVDLDGLMDQHINDYCENVEHMTGRTWMRVRNEIIARLDERNSRKQFLGKVDQIINVA